MGGSMKSVGLIRFLKGTSDVKAGSILKYRRPFANGGNGRDKKG
jgi:hypothetical protein